MLLFTSPVFSHFLGLTLIISISHLSAYLFTHIHLLQCDSEFCEEFFITPEGYSLILSVMYSAYTNFLYCSSLNTKL